MSDRVGDLTGRDDFGRWTVLRLGKPWSDGDGLTRPRWECRCVCGKEKLVHQVALLSGKSKSCGCLQKERATAATARRWKRIRAAKAAGG